MYIEIGCKMLIHIYTILLNLFILSFLYLYEMCHNPNIVESNQTCKHLYLFTEMCP